MKMMTIKMKMMRMKMENDDANARDAVCNFAVISRADAADAVLYFMQLEFVFL